ncbi:complex I NDUFA9 subunit family protein [Wenzhouxiangella sp. XN79A]|uniref:complex I NDUFA9 subunit family protein n=1 Tax=Wenzhouxiangella sp. XN79A TaxID=2724193 RepID=UPI00144ABE2F|nr:complex I NDUFA9 subunit family protein [Wenzhouxiangella sp. XN79A]NKI35283.1 complex I NDUFA9 subunit family protein [Wenzhouxiangella sp. XN79A]
MKILILGGSGFVGGHLSRRLSRAGHRVTVATRHAPTARRLKIVPGLAVRAFDPYDVEALSEALAGHDVLINLVGILNERGFSGAGFRRAHVELVEGAIEACRRAGVARFVHMSALNAGQGESHYLITRGEGEQRVRESGLDWTMVRPSTIFGPDDSFLNRFAGLLAISPVLPLARPQARFAPVWIGDVVEAFARALERDDSVGEVYELCGREIWRLDELVRWVARQRGMKRLVVGLPDALGWLQGKVFDLVPGKPFSSDNFKSLKIDSVCSEPGFERLGIEPWGMADKAVEWLADGGRQSRYQRFRQRARRS